MSDGGYRGLSRAQLWELECDKLKAEKRAAMQLSEAYENLLNRVLDPAASEATTEPARALPAPAPVAGGSGQLVQPPALPGTSVRRSAPRSRDREPGMGRSAHTRTLAYGGRATCTPIMYVGLPSYGIMY
jgi:hypothetical protein